MKKLIFIILIVLITLFSMLALLYKTSYSALYAEKILSQNKEIQNAFKNYEILTCNFHLTEPKYVFISFQHYSYPEDEIDIELLRIDFYNLFRANIFSRDWEIKRTGGTTVENATYAELLKMTKKNCSQFQKSKGDFRDKTINWSYSPFDPELNQITPNDSNLDNSEPKKVITSEEAQREIDRMMEQSPAFRRNVESRLKNPPTKYKVISE